eukprot:Sdes_comp17953_c0_seq1m7211
MKKSAFLACDLQNGILARLDPNKKEKLIQSTKNILNKIRQSSKERIEIIYVAVRFREGHPEISDENKFFKPIKANNLLVEGSFSAEIISEVAPLQNEIVVAKRRIGPFLTTDLNAILRAKGIQKLYLAGVSTRGVILSATREASDL